MKNLKWILCGLLALGFIATVMVSCKDDDGPTAFTLESLTAGAIDLNGATSPTGVPTNPTITATFAANVDAATATAANIKLTRDYDDADLPLTITVAGKTITIKPVEALGTGSLYELKMGSGLKSTENIAFTETARNFTTEGTFAPAGVIAHFTFENNVNDVVGSFDPTTGGTAVTYVDSRKAAAGKAASFNGTTTIIEVPNGHQLMSHGDFAVSFWMKVDGSKEGHFVFGLGAWYGFQFEIAGGAWAAEDKGMKLATRYNLGATTDAEDTWWNGQANGWQGSLVSKEITGGIGTIIKDKWAHVVCSYNKTTKVGTMYVNGDKVREWDFDLWPNDSAKKNATGVKFAGNTTDGGNNLAIGFIQASGNRIVTDTWADPSNPDNNHFKGQLDDIRFFSKPITSTEVSLMYNSEKP